MSLKKTISSKKLRKSQNVLSMTPVFLEKVREHVSNRLLPKLNQEYVMEVKCDFEAL